MGKGGGMADIADGDYTYDLPSYDPKTMSSVGVTVNNTVGGNDRSGTNANGNANPTADNGSAHQQQISNDDGTSGSGALPPPERYASRDVELYASSFAPPPELDKSGGAAAANGHGNAGGDSYADSEAEYDDEDVSSLDVRVRRDVQRRFLTFFGAVLLLSVTIGFFVPFSQKKRESSSIGDSLGLRGNENNQNNVKKQRPAIPPPPSSLGDLCADASRTTDPILTRECFEECDKAMCCTYPVDDARNCVDETTEATCAAYDEACSQYGDDGYGIGDGDDGEEYLDGEMDGEVGGGNGNSNAQYRGQKIPMAPSHLADTCSEDTMIQGGQVECEELCVEYTDCCLEDFCRQNNAEACDTYQPCEILANGEDIYTDFGDTSSLKDVELAEAPENLDEICSPFALSSGGLSARADCTSICSDFEECCRDDGCLASNADACSTYDACENLLQPEMVLDPSDIPTYCHGRGILTKEGIMTCKALCDPGLCCLISPFVGKEEEGLLRGIESCIADKGSDFCDMYSECEILLDVDDENFGDVGDSDEDNEEDEGESSVIPLAPQNIEEICSKRGLMNIEKYRECKGACTQARCCWSAEHYSCEKKTSTHRCDEYAPCSRLEGREPGVGDTLFDDDDWDDEVDGKYVLDIMEELDEPNDSYRDEKTGFSTGSTVTKAKIDAACSTASVLTASGEKVCEDLCEPGSCCASGTCGGKAVKMNCSMYKACDNIRDIQREKALTGGGGEDTATSTSASEIDDSTAKGILEKALQVQETCTESNVATSDGRKACERLCLSHLCCFAPENDCADSLGAQCLEYAACKHLIDWEDR